MVTFGNRKKGHGTGRFGAPLQQQGVLLSTTSARQGWAQQVRRIELHPSASIRAAGAKEGTSIGSPDVTLATAHGIQNPNDSVSCSP